MRISYFIALMLWMTSLFMMGQTRYCLSYEDFKNNRWIETALPIKVTQKNTIGLGDLVFTTGDKDFDKLIKKEARFIIHEDILYVNNRKLKGKGTNIGKNYTQAFRFGNDSVCIIGPRGIKGGKAAFHFAVNLAVNALILPFTGVAVMAVPTRENYPVCYLMTSDDRKLQMISPKHMEQLLINDPVSKTIYETYNKIEKESANIILPLLEKLDLLRPY